MTLGFLCSTAETDDATNAIVRIVVQIDFFKAVYPSNKKCNRLTMNKEQYPAIVTFPTHRVDRGFFGMLWPVMA